MFLDFNPISLAATLRAFPKIVERSMWRRGLIHKKISRVVSKSLEIEQRKALFQKAIGFVPMSVKDTTSAINLLEAWTAGTLSHQQTVDGLQIVIKSLDRRRFLPERGFYLASVLTAFGLFSSADQVHRASRSQVRREASSRMTIHSQIRGVQAAIVDGDATCALGYAASAYELLQNTPLNATKVRSLAPLFRYVESWSGQNVLPPNWEDGLSLSEDWTLALDSRPAILIGPAPIEPSSLFADDNNVVFRLAAPGAFDFIKSDRELDITTDGIYVNGNNLDEILLRQNGSEALTRNRFNLVKGQSAHRLPGLRNVDNLYWFFLSGHSQMAPIAIVDLVVLGSAQTYVTGVDFFSNRNAYRSESLRKFAAGTGINSVGSYGGRFDRCGAFASHNLLENRAIVRNLFVAGRVTGDRAFTEALLLGGQEYAKTLDELYGLDQY